MKTRKKRQRRNKTNKYLKYKIGGNEIINIREVRDMIKSDFRKLLILLSRHFTQLSPEIHSEIINSTINLHLSNEIETYDALLILLRYPQNEHVLEYFRHFPDGVVLSVAIINLSKVNDFVHIFDYLNQDVNMQIPIFEDTVEHLPNKLKYSYRHYYTLLDLTILMYRASYEARKIARYLIEHGAIVSHENFKNLLSLSDTYELIQRILEIGEITIDDNMMDYIVNWRTLSEEQKQIKKFIIDKWNKSLITYTLAKTTPANLAYGMEEFNDFYLNKI